MTPDERFEDLVNAVERTAAAVELIADERATGNAEFVSAIERLGESLDRILLALRDR